MNGSNTCNDTNTGCRCSPLTPYFVNGTCQKCPEGESVDADRCVPVRECTPLNKTCPNGTKVQCTPTRNAEGVCNSTCTFPSCQTTPPPSTCTPNTRRCSLGNTSCNTGGPKSASDNTCKCNPPSCSTQFDFYSPASLPTATPVANNTTKLKVSWNKQTTQIGYTVYYCQGTTTQCPRSSNRNGTHSTNWKSITGTHTNSAEITGLIADTQYWVMLYSTGFSAGVEDRAEARGYTYYREYSRRATATTNKQCPATQTCGLGTSTTGGVVSAGTTCTACPTPPTVQSTETSVNPTSCNTNVTFKYTGGNSYRSRMSNGTTLPNKTYSRSTATGLSFYTLKNNDYNKTLTFYASTRKKHRFIWTME